MAALKSTHIKILPPPPFNFAATVYSHGWAALRPNEWDRQSEILQRTEQLNDGSVVHLSLQANAEADQEQHPQLDIRVSHSGNLGASNKKEIVDRISTMLRLEEDLGEFYRYCEQHDDQWVALPRSGFGRLLRSPELFEDIVKTICTTNIQWGGTKRMVSELVEAYGASLPGSPAVKTFPSAEAIASDSLTSFEKKVNLGYRGAYVHLLAQRLASGELNIDDFWNNDLSNVDLRKQLLAIKGIGKYAAANLLMILGRYDELPVDSVFREFVSKKYFAGKKVDDKEMIAIYDDWDEWKFLAYWFDLWQEPE